MIKNSVTFLKQLDYNTPYTAGSQFLDAETTRKRMELKTVKAFEHKGTTFRRLLCDAVFSQDELLTLNQNVIAARLNPVIGKFNQFMKENPAARRKLETVGLEVVSDPSSNIKIKANYAGRVKQELPNGKIEYSVSDKFALEIMSDFHKANKLFLGSSFNFGRAKKVFADIPIIEPAKSDVQASQTSLPIGADSNDPDYHAKVNLRTVGTTFTRLIYDGMGCTLSDKALISRMNEAVNQFNAFATNPTIFRKYLHRHSFKNTKEIENPAVDFNIRLNYRPIGNNKDMASSSKYAGIVPHTEAIQLIRAFSEEFRGYKIDMNRVHKVFLMH